MKNTTYLSGMVRVLGVLAIAASSLAAEASVVTYDYEAKITQSDWSVFRISSYNNQTWTLARGSSAFGGLDPFSNIAGLKVGDTFTGTFSYDTSATATAQSGWWSTTYGGATFTADLGMMSPGGATAFKYQSNQLAFANGSATVINGPAFPGPQQDSLSLSGQNVTDIIYRQNTESFALSFNPVGNTGPFTSTALPSSLSLATMPYSGGYISRSSIEPDSYSGREQLAFQFASLNIAPIPEPETWALMLAGLGMMGFVARRRQRG